jgi:hypothetical protein
MLVIWGCLGASATQAATQDDSLTPPAQTAPLRQVLDIFDSDSRQGRKAIAVTQGLLGAAMLGPGIALSRRADSELQFIGAGFIVAGSIQLATVPLLLIPMPIERIHDHLNERLARGEDEATVARAIETELRDASARKERTRPYVGAAGLALGTAGLATGMVFLLARPGLGGMARQTQYIWGAALVGAGAPFVTMGLHNLLQRSPEESAWAAYRAARLGMQPTGVDVPRFSFFVGPTRRGAQGGINLVF